MTTASAPSPARRNHEINFTQDMIDHHVMAIMTSALCLQKAVHAELRTRCGEIIAAQRAEIAQMQWWLCAWYGIGR